MKKATVWILSAILMLGLCQSAKAEHTSGFLRSSSGSSWQVGVDPQRSVSYSTIYDHVCGGDVGVWFYTSQAGLQSGFKRDYSRTVSVYQYEKDNASQTHANTYIGYFGMYGSLYVPVGYSHTYTYPADIENDGAVELYIKFIVGIISGDKTDALPQGLLYYKHWVV